jgi:hypothetical protein
MLRCRLSGNLSGASQIYEKLLDEGKAKKVCTVCDRHLNDREMVVFEKFVRLFLRTVWKGTYSQMTS